MNIGNDCTVAEKVAVVISIALSVLSGCAPQSFRLANTACQGTQLLKKVVSERDVWLASCKQAMQGETQIFYQLVRKTGSATGERILALDVFPQTPDQGATWNAPKPRIQVDNNRFRWQLEVQSTDGNQRVFSEKRFKWQDASFHRLSQTSILSQRVDKGRWEHTARVLDFDRRLYYMTYGEGASAVPQSAGSHVVQPFLPVVYNRPDLSSADYLACLGPDRFPADRRISYAVGHDNRDRKRFDIIVDLTRWLNRRGEKQPRFPYDMELIIGKIKTIENASYQWRVLLPTISVDGYTENTPARYRFTLQPDGNVKILQQGTDNPYRNEYIISRWSPDKSLLVISLRDELYNFISGDNGFMILRSDGDEKMGLPDPRSREFRESSLLTSTLAYRVCKPVIDFEINFIDHSLADNDLQRGVKNAIEHNDAERVKQLLAEGANPNGWFDSGKKMLHKAASLRNAKIVALLLDAGADPNARDLAGKTPLMYVAVSYLPDYKAADAVAVSQMLIDHGARVNAGRGGSALRIAIEHNEYQVAKVLAEAGSDMSDKKDLRKLAMEHLNYPCGTDSKMSFLMDFVDLDYRYSDSRTVLHRAIDNCKWEFAKRLVERGVNINGATDYGLTPLMMAVSAQRRDLIRLLLSHGAIVDRQNNDGETALFYAVEYNDIETVKILLQAGASLEVLNAKGHNVTAVAKQAGYSELAEMLSYRKNSVLDKN